MFGFKSLESITLNVDKNLFKGGTLAGRMDSNYWRTETVGTYEVTLKNEPLEIGSGKEERVNTKIMKKYKCFDKMSKKSYCCNFPINLI